MGGHGGERPPGLVGPAGLLRIPVVRVEYDGVGAEQPEPVEVVEDLLDGADSGGPFGVVDGSGGQPQGDAGREARQRVVRQHGAHPVHGQPQRVPGVAHETLLHRYCLRQGRPVLVSRMREDDFDRVAPTESAAAKMRAAGVHSYLAVPLIARGLLLGSADFVRGPGTPPFSDTDLALAEQLASQAAVYIDNARLYGREREHVVSLQRSLLPRATPLTPGLRVHAEYTPS
ncbi:GAF domain-containing protein, partial [Streptomyces massasporeus]